MLRNIRSWLLLGSCCSFIFSSRYICHAEETAALTDGQRTALKLPLNDPPRLLKSGAHPLDPVIATALNELKHIRTNVLDYSCIMVRQERIDGRLGPHEFIAAKVRNGREDNGTRIPFSVYLKFLKPDRVKGREVLYVDGKNDGELFAGAEAAGSLS